MKSRARRRQARLNKLIVSLSAVLLCLMVFAVYVYGFSGVQAAAAPPVVPQAQAISTRAVPAMLQPVFPSQWTKLATYSNGTDEVSIDTSNIRDGYILVSCVTDRQTYVVLEKDEKEHIDYLPTDGAFHVIPLTLGDGEYQLRINLQNQGNAYYRILETGFSVVIENPHTRFLLPIPIADYTENTTAVQVARRLYSTSASNADFIDAAYRWAHGTARYDLSLLDDEESGSYIPDLERIVSEGTAICSDYAALFAAMLRSCGIPCQIIYGDIETATGVMYHAWNLVWVEGEGGGKWWRYDPTQGYEPADPDNTATEPVLLRGTPIYGEARVIH